MRVVKLLKQRRYRDTIVDAALFDAVQERLSRAAKPGSRRIREYPLSGAMACASCGRHLHGVARGGTSRQRLADNTIKVYAYEKTRYYACAVCNYAINAERAEKQYFASIGELVADERLLKRWISAPPKITDNVSKLKNELALLESEVAPEFTRAKRNRLFELALSVSIDELEFKRQIDRLEDEVRAKQARMQDLRQLLFAGREHKKSIALAQDLLKRFHELYESASYEMKRELLSALSAALGGVTVSCAGLAWTAESQRAALK